MSGTLWGIGIGPGDPELLTVKAARLLGQARHVIAPVARVKSESLALAIARPHLNPQATIHEREFPMTRDQEQKRARWREAAAHAIALLESGEDVFFPTLGDPSLYSTWIYLARAVQELSPTAKICTVPGITSFCAAAAACGVPLAEEGQILTIVPASSDDPEAVRQALRTGPAVLMKVGDRAQGLHQLIGEVGRATTAVLAVKVGLEGERFLQGDRIAQAMGDSAYLSLLLVPEVQS